LVIAAAEKSQQQKDEHHISDANPQRTEFAIDSFVLVSYPTSNLKKGPPNKLQTNLKGPFKVKGHRGAMPYTHWKIW